MNIYLVIMLLILYLILVIYSNIINIDGYIINEYLNNINSSYYTSINTYSTNDLSVYKILRDNYNVIKDEYINYTIFNKTSTCIYSFCLQRIGLNQPRIS